MADDPPAIDLPRQKWRETFWGNQRDQIIAARRLLSQDPTTLALLLRYIETLVQRALPSHEPPIPVRVRCTGLDPDLLARVWEDVGPDPDTILTALCDRVRQVAPPLAHGLQERLPAFLANMALFLSGVPVEDLPFEVRISRLLPDNPFPLVGDASFQDVCRMELKHFHQIRDLKDSYRSRRPRGRPKKTEPGAPKEHGDPERDKLALEAYRLKRDGLAWHTIARRLLPGADRSERTRDKVRRLVSLGARLAFKTPVSD